MKQALKTLKQGTLRSYAAVLFMDGELFGAALLALTMIKPGIGAGGLVGAVTANVAAMAFSYPRALISSGLYAISPLLVGMAIAFFAGPGAGSSDFLQTWLIIAAAALFTMPLHTLLADRLYKAFRIGSQSMAFAIVATIVALHARAPGSAVPPLDFSMEEVEIYLRSLGAIFFMPDPVVGGLIFAALLLYSRVLATLSIVGFGFGSWIFTMMGGTTYDLAYGMVGMNFILTAMAVGGFYLLPGPIATLHACAAVLVTSFVAVVISRVLSPAGLPVFSWPFNLATICWLGALSLRTGGGEPMHTWGFFGSPEEMSAQSLLLARVCPGPGKSGSAAGFTHVPHPAVRLPVIGEWTVTQSIGGEPTHRPPWSHAWDFEVMDEAGFPFRVDQVASGGRDENAQMIGLRGSMLDDYYAFGAPVVAVADGVVSFDVSGVPDNAPGTSNIRENFGNQLVIRHGEAFFSVYAHLKNGSLRVKQGDAVFAGQIIAQCGSSGRSPRPHLHFHLQADSTIGSPTLSAQFAQYVVRDRAILQSGNPAKCRPTVPTHDAGPSCPADDIKFVERGAPSLFERVTSISSYPGSRPAPGFSAGLRWSFDVTRFGRTHREVWNSDLDLWGGIKLVAERPFAEAVWKVDAEGMTTAVFFRGSHDGALYAFFVGNSLYPSHLAPRLGWTDFPGATFAESRTRNLIREICLPFARFGSSSTRFLSHTADDSTVIEACNRHENVRTVWDGAGAPRLIQWQRGNGNSGIATIQNS